MSLNDYIYWQTIKDTGMTPQELYEYEHPEVVRCKDCKYAHMTYAGDCKYCDVWKNDDGNCIELYLDGDFYCSYGKRKESK